MQSSLAPLTYRSDIDGLRAIAVLAVVSFHAWPGALKGGFAGVDVFFVISGYLISKIILHGLDSGTFRFAEFYSRRIRRIFPALLLMLMLCFVFGWFALTADEYRQLGSHIVAGSTFTSNLVLWGEAGYFDSGADAKPLLHLWSLAVEEQFYIIWPIFLWLSYRNKAWLFFITVLTLGLSFIHSLVEIRNDPIAAFYLPQDRFWELLVGSAVAWFDLYGVNVLARARIPLRFLSGPMRRATGLSCDRVLVSDALSVGGLLLLAYSFWRLDKLTAFPGWWVVMPVLGTALVISAGADAWLNRVILSNSVLRWFGVISFPLYLWHWPLLSYARIIQGRTPSAGFSAAMVLLAVMLAWITYRFVERPVRKQAVNVKIMSFLIIAMICAGYSGHYTEQNNGLKFRSIALKSNDLFYDWIIKDYKRCSIDALGFNRKTLHFCLSNPLHEANSAIIGDSHAEDKFHGLIELDKKNSWMLIGHSSCPPLRDVNVERDQKGCEGKFRKIFAYLASDKNIKNVVLSFYANYSHPVAYAADHLENNISGVNPTKISSGVYTGTPEELSFLGLNSAVKLLIENGKSVTLFIDVPELPFYPKDCIRRPLKDCSLQRSEVAARQDRLRDIIKRLKKSNPQLLIFDPIDLFCDAVYCKYMEGGVLLYRDSHHLSMQGSNLYARKYMKWRDGVNVAASPER